jgi:hypothetical protein
MARGERIEATDYRRRGGGNVDVCHGVLEVNVDGCALCASRGRAIGDVVDGSMGSEVDGGRCLIMKLGGDDHSGDMHELELQTAGLGDGRRWRGRRCGVGVGEGVC